MIPVKQRKTDRWSLLLENPAPSIIHTRISGYADMELVQQFWDYFEEVARTQAPIENFHDWADVESYDPQVRQRYMKWSREHRPQLRAVHILVRSRWVSMGVTVANLALGYLTSYRDREKFESALAAAVKRR